MGANMKRRKMLVALLLILSLSIANLFAGAEWENVLIAQPTDVINNQSILIEMSQGKAIDCATAFGSLTYSEPYKSSYKDYGDIVLFTLINTLDSSKNGSDNISVKITSDNATGFFFTKDGNETNNVRYELEACILEFKKKVSFGFLTVNVDYPRVSDNCKKMTTGTPQSISDNKTTLFKSNGDNEYELSVPTTEYESILGAGLIGEYPKYLRYYYICVKIIGGQNLEEGTYTSSFTITSNNLSDSPIRCTIKGYVGEKPYVESTVCNFYIDPASDSYFTDLVVKKMDTSPSKDVAKLRLYNTRRKEYSSSSTPSADNLKKRFTVYISPTSVYSDNGRYVFKKIGTENQSDDNFAYRIYYEIDTTNTTGLTKLNNNTANNTYYFYPEYTNQVISSSSGSKTYQEFWKLEDKHIYIKVSEESKEDDENMHAIGTYTSTIYFTIVPNDSL